MKKEFLDHLYELRALVQNDIDRLVEVCKSPRDRNWKAGCFEPEAEIRTRRSQISSLNKTIEKYLELHN